MTFSTIVLVRGRKDIAAQVLEAVIQKPGTAPTRIFGKIGVSYPFLQAMFENGLIHLEPKGRKRFEANITERASNS